MAVRTTRQKISKFVLSIVVWFFGVIMVVPFIWMISAAFKTQTAVYSFPIQWIPEEPTLKAFQLLFKKVPYWTYFFNSVKVAAIACIGTFFSCTLAGYAYAKIPFKGRNGLFMLKLVSTMLPGLVTMVPNYMIYSKLGLVGYSRRALAGQFLGARRCFPDAAGVYGAAGLSDRVGANRRRKQLPHLLEHCHAQCKIVHGNAGFHVFPVDLEQLRRPAALYPDQSFVHAAPRREVF